MLLSQLERPGKLQISLYRRSRTRLGSKTLNLSYLVLLKSQYYFWAKTKGISYFLIYVGKGKLSEVRNMRSESRNIADSCKYSMSFQLYYVLQIHIAHQLYHLLCWKNHFSSLSHFFLSRSISSYHNLLKSLKIIEYFPSSYYIVKHIYIVVKQHNQLI